MIHLRHVTKTFSQTPVFEDLTLKIDPKHRLGLVGKNGCGKSTLLKLISGDLEPESGKISLMPGIKINYLSQEPKITPGRTLEAEMKSVFHTLNELQTEEETILTRLENLHGEAQLAALHRLDLVHQEMRRLDASRQDALIGRTLKGLGFLPEDTARNVETFSGGWQMRINLAKILIDAADVLLLDEPTNHLDLASCEWLEGFLTEYPGAIILVSHDRHFLDQICTGIAELELGRLTFYSGNYTAYLTQKQAGLEALSAAYERQQKTLAKQSAFIERFRASATKSTQAKSREKQLEKIERIEVPQTDHRLMTARFPLSQTSGKQVLTLRQVQKSYNGRMLFQNLTADLQRQQRVFLLGPNGCGKTTLFRLILGLEPPDTGELRIGHQVCPGYFSQNQLETLLPDKTVFKTLRDVCSIKLSDTEVRSMLGRFLFTGDQVFKPVRVLSGGEKSKLALAVLMAQGPNTLLLDEPTNHMDISSKEALEQAFSDYEGTLLCISHDRFFIQQLATDIWEIYAGRLICYPGNYEYYLAKRDELRQLVLEKEVSPKSVDTPVMLPEKPSRQAEIHQTLSGQTISKKSLEKELGKLERRIIKLEEELAGLSEQMNQPTLQQDYEALHALSRQAEEKQSALAQLNEVWEKLAEAL